MLIMKTGRPSGFTLKTGIELDLVADPIDGKINQELNLALFDSWDIPTIERLVCRRVAPMVVECTGELSTDGCNSLSETWTKYVTRFYHFYHLLRMVEDIRYKGVRMDYE